MRTTLHLRIDHAEGSLQRLIGLAERRGFHIDGLTLIDEGSARRVALLVRARDQTRCAATLGRQIDRLVGVRRMAAGDPPSDVAVRGAQVARS